ncbi:hypothetical protein BIY26_20410 [Brenneria goodwinii]|uniref:Cytoplasmic protein n=1 Tax=Brenneria goodwinii TaxID=1109412 RepID=A0A0G4JXW0_9GAMM|nr:DUF1456 family protein [Brenneria goodwinii]ATA23235.1 hypothetical protein AWC36_03470 [Brenneria goodwinii]MCG8157617.1 DUF1456 family protein [Brenneria goodwinii]MCG8161898.1 DUF1456 family protein [Brenneria goodwinii]MCG8166695.1 DUF1456 family protein [Brenneria goodwinii]MCG8171154.1 DUF1456 family protein [Brenneria goodwinii]
MINNDVLRSVRYMLNLNNEQLIDILALMDTSVTPQQMAGFVKKEEEEGYQLCPDILMGAFLDGLIIHKRGKDDSRPAPKIERRITNNIILKKLRVAFALKTTDIQEILQAQNFRLSQPELTAMLRAPDHKNYRECGDQVLRYFLKGLAVRLRKG